MKKLMAIGMVLLMVSLALVVAAPREGSLLLEGSTTVGPIGDAFAQAFKKMYPDVSITVNKTGSGNGAAALVDQRCDIAMMSRFMKEKEYKKATSGEKAFLPVAHAIAMDGVCVIVYPSNPVKALTRAQVRDIYKGKITNWKELGGTDMKIVPISRDTSSGTYETFEGLVMNKEKMAGNVEYVSSNPQAHSRVQSTAGGIGYVGLGFVDDKVKALEIDGVTPTRSSIAKGVYPISRPLFLFTNGYPKLGSLVHEFCTFYLTEEGQEIIEAKGFVPVTAY